MSDERNVEVYEVTDGHDRYHSMSEVLALLPGDARLPAKGDIILLQSELSDAEQNHHGRGVAYRVVEREFFYREDRRVVAPEEYARRFPAIWLFVRRVPEAEYAKLPDLQEGAISS